MSQWESVPFYMSATAVYVSGETTELVFEFPPIKWPSSKRPHRHRRRVPRSRRSAPGYVAACTRLGHDTSWAAVDNNPHYVHVLTSLGKDAWIEVPETALVNLAAVLRDPQTPQRHRDATLDMLAGSFPMAPQRHHLIRSALVARAAEWGKRASDVWREAMHAALCEVEFPFLSPDDIRNGQVPSRSFRRVTHSGVANSVTADFLGPDWRKGSETRPGRPQEVQATDPAPDLFQDAHPDPLESAIGRDLQNALWRMLTTREKRVCELFTAGLSPADVAARLGMSRSTVYVHLRSIRAKLEVILGA
jgi:DNA-binding CsgD family transcriptional regulator